MVSKLREKVQKLREDLFKFFCVCSAGTPSSSDEEAPHQQEQEGDGRLRFVTPRQFDASIDNVPRHSQVGGKVPYLEKLGFSGGISRALNLPRHQAAPLVVSQIGDSKLKLGLNRDKSCATHRMMPRQQISGPFQFQNAETRGAMAKTLDQVTAGDFSIQKNGEKRGVAPSQHISVPPQHVSRPCRFQNLFKFFLPRQQEQEGRDIAASIDVPHQSENGNMKKAVPHQQGYFSHQELFAACQQVPRQQNGEKRGAAPPQQVSVPPHHVSASPQQNEQMGGAVPRQHVLIPPQQIPVPPQAQNGEERDAIVKTEIASLLEQATGRPSASSLQRSRRCMSLSSGP